MKLNATQRETLKQKYNGHCAYCGIVLGERWHADHLEPVERNWESYKDAKGQWKTRATDMNKPENDHIGNLMPACTKCNNDKHSMTLKNWRYMIKDRVRTLNENPKYASYQKAKRFGLVIETDIPVVFYFERLERQLELLTWENAPEWANFLYKNSMNTWYWGKYKPLLDTEINDMDWLFSGQRLVAHVEPDDCLTGIDWKKSLKEKPSI